MDRKKKEAAAAARRHAAELLERDHRIGLLERQAAHLEEIIAAYRDTLETYHRETQARTAVALAEREALRRVEGGRTR